MKLRDFLTQETIDAMYKMAKKKPSKKSHKQSKIKDAPKTGQG